MNVPEELLYSKEHEWILVEEEMGTVGITDFAQSELGDVVYVELAEVGEEVQANDAVGSLESVKAVSEVYAPVSGKIREVNDILADSPETVNEDPYGEGWLVKIRLEDPAELDDLMSAQEYVAYVKEESKD